jgi:ATP-binding cassette subfamily B protein
MATFLRLLGFLRDHKRGVWLSGILAALAMGATVAIPALTGAAIDAIDSGDNERLKLLALLIAAAGLVRLGLTVARRLIAGKVSLGVELDLRNRLYEHLLSLELGFFDRQQTGQLMSRATVDLQAVRFFLGYGLVLISQAALTIAFAAVAMVVIDPVLALIALSPVPFVVWIAMRYGRQARPALQEVQQRIAELTADVEENVGGVRVVKAFAREERQYARFGESVARVFEQSMISTRLRAFYNPFLGFLPQIGLALLLLLGGRAVIDGSLSLGAFTAFYTYLLALLGPVRTLGVLLGMSQRATASGARIFELLDREPRIVAPRDAPTLPDGAGRVEFRDVSLTFEGGRVVKARGRPQDRLEKLLDSDEGARSIGEFSFGFNPFILRPMLDTLFDEKIAGSLHFTPGQAYALADNGNRSQIHWDLVLIQRPEYGGGEVWLDGERVRRDGLFLPPELQGLNPEALVGAARR